MSNPTPVHVGKRGSIVIPAELRREYQIEDGSLLVAEARPEGILLRRARLLVEETPGWRERMIAEFNSAVAELKQEPAAWAEELAGRAAWDAASMDGIEVDAWDGPTEPPGKRQHG